MYKVSNAFKEAITGRSRMIEWWGTITLTTGEVYTFTKANIVENTGTLTRSCSSESSIDLGGVYASELQITLRLDIDRYLLSNAVIKLYARLKYLTTVETWEDASPYSWEDLISVKWGDKPKNVYSDVPMGVFVVSEALRAVNSIKITAYDYMLNFDKSLPTMDTEARTPFDWLRWICNACDVELALINNDIRSLPNGTRNLTYAGVNTEVSTYRDLLSELATALGSIATIDRKGKLTLMQYDTTPVDTVTASLRYSSDFSDYQSYYTGMYASYRAKAIQEYFKNVGTLDDTGSVMNIGYNVFLQIASDSNRKTAVQAIIDALKNRKYTPFNVTMPFNPAYDLMDILKFTDNQTQETDIAPITSITFKVNDSMTVQCVGENPKLSTAQSKESKAIEGLNDGTSLSGTSYVSSDFWIMLDTYPPTDVEIQPNEEAITTELTVNCTVDNTRTQILWTGTYSIDEAAKVIAMVYADDTIIYGISDEQTAGQHCLTVSTGWEFITKGEHQIKIVIKEVPMT